MQRRKGSTVTAQTSPQQQPTLIHTKPHRPVQPPPSASFLQCPSPGVNADFLRRTYAQSRPTPLPPCQTCSLTLTSADTSASLPLRRQQRRTSSSSNPPPCILNLDLAPHSKPILTNKMQFLNNNSSSPSNSTPSSLHRCPGVTLLQLRWACSSDDTRLMLALTM